MDKFKKNSIWYDSVILAIIFVIGFTLMSVFAVDFSFKFDAVGSVLIGLFGTLLGFAITAFTILFMFDTDKNTVLNKIKKAGLFSQIYERFITAIVINFIALVYSLLYLFISGTYNNILFLNIILVYICFLTFVRIYRILRILYLIHQTVK